MTRTDSGKIIGPKLPKDIKTMPMPEFSARGHIHGSDITKGL